MVTWYCDCIIIIYIRQSCDQSIQVLGIYFRQDITSFMQFVIWTKHALRENKYFTNWRHLGKNKCSALTMNRYHFRHLSHFCIVLFKEALKPSYSSLQLKPLIQAEESTEFANILFKPLSNPLLPQTNLQNLHIILQSFNNSPVVQIFYLKVIQYSNWQCGILSWHCNWLFVIYQDIIA